ncbi:MAG: MmgE/PrpD family protein [Chloroflexi bacterium]|nr:MmgE/PrpD family protein [Chloroflexota bacterium]MYD49523.1 MmgE/PrpD family protein [Chloroflexota bacterium]
MSATRTLAQFISDTDFADLPPPVVEAAKIAILDGVANVVAGSVQELADIIGRYVQDAGGSPQSSVVGWGYQTNPPAAAFANGVFGHCLDYEIQGFPPTHGTSSCLPAALALAEQHHVPGRRVITAYALGWEIQGRLRAASAPATRPGYHPPGLVGPLGGAAAAAKTLDLDTEQTLMALGIAASRTGGLTANTGTMVKSTHPGNAARMGAEAGILAAMGYTASDEALESPVGYAAALFGGELDWEVATGSLGASWRLADPGFDIKRFPAQVYMQNVIEAALNLREQNNVDPNNIQQVTIHRRGRGHSGPVPRSGLDGKFSVEYCAAAALLDGHVGIDTFTDARRFAPDMEDMLGRIQVEPEGPESGATLTTAVLKDGATVSGECAAFRGSATNPMSRDERLAKVRDCFQRALSDSDTERVLEMLENLEHLDDTAQLMSVLGQPAAGRG